MREPDAVRVRHNDYGALRPPEVGTWLPHLSVSVVIPAYRCQDTLDLTLASLAAQTYPSHLLEVVVVDDGSRPPLRLPEVVPQHTRLIRAPDSGWGRAHACHQGALAAEGHVIHWLDSDMVVYHDHVEAQLRWHHLAEYLVVLGYKRFIPFDGGDVSAQEVLDAVAAGAAEKLFEFDLSTPHAWVEKYMDDTRGLRDAGHLAFRVHVGATASLRAGLYRAAGGMDTSLVLGEDTELAYRLAQAGAVFVPEPQARSWHLGETTVMQREIEVRRHNEPFLANRVPQLTYMRKSTGRQWLVPYLSVIVSVGEESYENVRSTVESVLSSTFTDVRVTLVAPWDDLTDVRRHPLNDPLLDLRLIRSCFLHDQRVEFASSVADTPFPAPFRLTVPAGWRLVPNALQRLVQLAEQGGHGAVLLSLPSRTAVRVARLERTAALRRAELLRRPDEDPDDIIGEIFGVHWVDGTDWAFLPPDDGAIRLAGEPPEVTLERVTSSASISWKRFAKRVRRRLGRYVRRLRLRTQS